MLPTSHSRAVRTRLALFCFPLSWHQWFLVYFFSSTKYWYTSSVYIAFFRLLKYILSCIITFSVLVIVGVYTALFISIRQTRSSTPLAPNEIEIAVRFFFIVFTDCLCWMPTILLKIMALSNVYIPGRPNMFSLFYFSNSLFWKRFLYIADLYAWLVVFVLPVNSGIHAKKNIKRVDWK